jgi:hypothetical protein
MKTLTTQTITTYDTFTTNYEKPVDKHFHNVMIPKIPSYEFRVVEWVNDKGDIVKVGLQSRENIHNQYGSVEYDNPNWVDVERVRIPV